MDVRLLLKPGTPADGSQVTADAGSSEAVTLRGPWPDPVLRGEDSDAAVRAAP